MIHSPHVVSERLSWLGAVWRHLAIRVTLPLKFLLMHVLVESSVRRPPQDAPSSERVNTQQWLHVQPG